MGRRPKNYNQQNNKIKTTKPKNTLKKQKEQVDLKSPPKFNSFTEQYKYYCKNENLLKEMYKWRNSCDPQYNKKLKIDDNGKIFSIIQNKKYYITEPLKVKKLIDKRMYDTETYYDKDENFEFKLQNHEPYVKGVRYFIEFSKEHPRYSIKRSNNFKYYKETKNTVIEDVTELVENDGFCYDIDIPQERIFSDEFGNMVMLIAKKVSNHSFFRNYRQETKEDCQIYAIEKIFRGIVNYKLKFSNVFAYITTACFNSFKTELSKYYKQININRSMTKRALVRLASDFGGSSSIQKCLSKQFEGNDYDSFQEF